MLSPFAHAAPLLSLCAHAFSLVTDVSQMKITTYRYMILYHQQQAQPEKDVSIPEDQVRLSLPHTPFYLYMCMFAYR